MKIFIAVPTFENICPETFKSIYGLDRCGHWVVFDYIRGYDCATARNNIAKQTKKEKADYVLMVDSDIVLPSNALKLLLEDPVDVCLGCYAHRLYSKYDGRVTMFKMGEFDYTNYYTAAEVQALRDEGINRQQVHGGGMGCALIKADVFDRIQFPYFDWVNYSSGSLLGEDTFFCSRCKKAGIPVYMDTRVQCGHVFKYVQRVE